MSAFGDDLDMGRSWDDRLLAGERVEGDVALVTLVAALRASRTQPAPAPNATLSHLLQHGSALPAGSLAVGVRAPARSRARALAGRFAALGLAAKVAVGTGVALAAVGTTAVTNQLPGPAQQAVEGAASRIADVLTGGQPVPPSQPGTVPPELPSPATSPATPQPPAVVPPQPVQQPPARRGAVPPQVPAPAAPERDAGTLPAGPVRPPAPAPAPPVERPAPSPPEERPVQPAPPAERPVPGPPEEPPAPPPAGEPGARSAPDDEPAQGAGAGTPAAGAEAAAPPADRSGPAAARS